MKIRKDIRIAGLALLGSAALLGTAAAAQGRQKVVGIGAFFFRSRDPEMLHKWYHDKLGVEFPPRSYEAPIWMQEAGPTNFEAFPGDSEMFGDPSKDWIINFRVKDIRAMVAQLRAEGEKIKGEPEEAPNGWFASLKDPEGNPIQLWQYKKPQPPKSPKKAP